MEDFEIVNLYFERSEDAIAETTLKYGKYCRTIAYNILFNFMDAEECENDTYIAVWNAIPPTRPRLFSAFIGRITRNIAINRYEYNKAQKRNSEFDLILSELEGCIAMKETVESVLEEKELANVINDFLKELKKETRVIFVRRYWYSDSIKDIAQRLNIRESKIKTVLFRTRKELQNFLDKKGVVI